MAKQPYDAENKYLLVPKTYGEGGYWKEFNWDKSLSARLGNDGLEVQRQIRLCLDGDVVAAFAYGGHAGQSPPMR